MDTCGRGGSSRQRQGIRLRADYFVLDWTVRVTRTTVVIDGRRQELPWGENFLPLRAGHYRLKLSYHYLGLAEAGRASMEVDVASGEVTHVSYRAPRSVLLAFRPGQLSIGT